MSEHSFGAVEMNAKKGEIKLFEQLGVLSCFDGEGGLTARLALGTWHQCTFPRND